MPHRRSISAAKASAVSQSIPIFWGGGSGACGGSGAVAVVSLFPPAARSEDLNLKDTK